MSSARTPESFFESYLRKRIAQDCETIENVASEFAEVSPRLIRRWMRYYGIVADAARYEARVYFLRAQKNARGRPYSIRKIAAMCGLHIMNVRVYVARYERG